jgi:hypothetical protein
VRAREQHAPSFARRMAAAAAAAFKRGGRGAEPPRQISARPWRAAWLALSRARPRRCHAAPLALSPHTSVRQNPGRRAGALPGGAALWPSHRPRHASCQPPRQRPTVHDGIACGASRRCGTSCAAQTAAWRSDVAAWRAHRWRGPTAAARRRGTAPSQALCAAPAGRRSQSSVYRSRLPARHHEDTAPTPSGSRSYRAHTRLV